MNLDILGWIGMASVVYGVWQIAKHHTTGFLYCILGDLVLGFQGFMLEMTSLMVLNLVLLYIHLTGYLNWSKMGI